MFSHSWMYFFVLLRSFVFIWVTEINLNPREHGDKFKKKKIWRSLFLNYSKLQKLFLTQKAFMCKIIYFIISIIMSLLKEQTTTTTTQKQYSLHNKNYSAITSK